MSREESKDSLPEWVWQKLAALRAQAASQAATQAAEPGQWPPMADQLLALVAGQTPSPEIDESDMDMLSLVVHDALMGVDVRQRYPTFWGKMLAAPALYQAFIEALELLEADGRQQQTTTLPTTDTPLTFLQKEPASAAVTAAAGAGWRITWKLLFAQWGQLLFPTPKLSYRRPAPLLEDESIILLHEEVTIEQQLVEVVLEAVWPVGQPEILRLQLLAAGEMPLPPLQAHLQWGDYRHTAVLDDYGRAHFPPLSLDDILDEAGQLRPTDLQLILESLQT